ncbi:PREDICTED: neuropeptide Y receptor-like isoform X2 [Nicrophorus vespilloides]|uniref:Neuropeptide Y receptor-like isoform X2 n=1 Tax=Nicrophorus vespilloides TaxID=110193 RepID=A0ABM1M844_NICVS|nr:PREDICTED: neuropeptide Y receptor-like isoform X2 [Nicrophorus vespilloides]XP_017770744.1 PREDICTED: neuropeptide Y receptor-like isoform X2 [Nicrophorus vespilloides]
MMITVVVVYTICWLPLNLIWLIADNYEVDERLMTYLWFSSHWFAMSHTCYNPIIYCYMNSRFRTCFFQVLSSVPCLRQCCATRILHRPSTSFPLTSVEGGTDSTLLHRNNTCTTYISMRRKNGNRLSTSACSVPVRSASMMRTSPNNNHQVVRRFRYQNTPTTTVAENAI